MRLPKFNYEPPILDSSRAIVLKNVLAEEFNSNYKSVNNFRTYLKSFDFTLSLILITIGLSLLASFNFRLFPDKPFIALFFPALIGFAAFFTTLNLIHLVILPQISSELKKDIVAPRNIAIANWVNARYGVEVNSDTISRLYNNYANDGDTLTRVGESLVRFQTVDGEGELLFDSSGAELKVLSLQS
jgi:hypothetical protein